MKGDRTYIISVEDNSTCLGAAEFAGSRKYLDALMHIATFIDERQLDWFIRVLGPHSDKVFNSADIKNFANAARAAGIDYKLMLRISNKEKGENGRKNKPLRAKSVGGRT